MSETVRPPRWRRFPDPRDRLIVAIDPAVLEAIAEDPVPASSEDIAALERTIAFRERVNGDGDYQREDWR